MKFHLFRAFKKMLSFRYLSCSQLNVLSLLTSVLWNKLIKLGWWTQRLTSPQKPQTQGCTQFIQDNFDFASISDNGAFKPTLWHRAVNTAAICRTSEHTFKIAVICGSPCCHANYIQIKCNSLRFQWGWFYSCTTTLVHIVWGS